MEAIKAKILRKPATNRPSIFQNHENKLRADYSAGYHRYFHLYFITDEEIKEGDWYCHSFEGEIIDVRQCKKSEGRLDYKIIATTNISLQAKIPKIPQSFIEEYCKKGGIEEVEVEIIKCCSRCSEALGDECQGDTTKVNPHNEIIIHQVKNSWNKQDVKEILNKLINDFVEGVFEENLRDEWIEENLK